MRPASLRTAYAALLSVAILSIVLGVLIEPKAFVENLLAEIAGITAGVVVAIAVIERLLTERRRTDWQRVREATFRGICHQMEDVAFEFYLAQPPPRSPELDFLQDLTGSNYAAAAASMEQLAEAHLQAAEALQPEGLPTDESSSRALYAAVSDALRTIRDVLTARAIGVTEDPRLVELLTELEARERDWRIALYNIEGWGAPDEIGWKAAARTLGAASAVYRYAAERLGEPRRNS